MLKTNNAVAKDALSLIEVMVAVSLISIILSALAVNMVYTQRTIANTRLRARAVDQANSCLDNFRNLRDSLVWWKFYQRLDDDCRENSTPDPSDINKYVMNSGDDGDVVICNPQYTLPAYDSLNRPAGICSDNPTDTGNCAAHIGGSAPPMSDNVICGPSLAPPTSAVETDAQIQYQGLYTVTVDPQPGPSPQKVGITVTITYRDFNDVERSVEVSQQFSQIQGEARAN